MAKSQNRKSTTSTGAKAAIATGVVSGIAAAVAGFLAFKKSGKTFPEFRNDVTTKVKDGLADAQNRASEALGRRKDGVDADPTQEQIAEEALTLKATGKKAKKPIDPVVDAQTKAGAISY